MRFLSLPQSEPQLYSGQQQARFRIHIYPQPAVRNKILHEGPHQSQNTLKSTAAAAAAATDSSPPLHLLTTVLTTVLFGCTCNTNKKAVFGWSSPLYAFSF